MWGATGVGAWWWDVGVDWGWWGDYGSGIGGGIGIGGHDDGGGH